MDEKPFETMNVIPFVDIMLVLLAIVLTTASFVATGRIPVKPPAASPAPSEQHKQTMIEIAADGAAYVDGQPASEDEIRAKLSGLPPDSPILIRADRTLALQRFVDIADLLKSMSFVKVGLQTTSRQK